MNGGTNGMSGPAAADPAPPAADPAPPAADPAPSAPFTGSSVDIVAAAVSIQTRFYYGTQTITMSASEPKADASEPIADASEPKADASEPKADASEPKADASEPKADASEPKADASEPKTDASNEDRIRRIIREEIARLNACSHCGRCIVPVCGKCEEVDATMSQLMSTVSGRVCLLLTAFPFVRDWKKDECPTAIGVSFSGTARVDSKYGQIADVSDELGAPHAGGSSPVRVSRALDSHWAAIGPTVRVLRDGDMLIHDADFLVPDGPITVKSFHYNVEFVFNSEFPIPIILFGLEHFQAKLEDGAEVRCRGLFLNEKFRRQLLTQDIYPWDATGCQYRASKGLIYPWTVRDEVNAVRHWRDIFVERFEFEHRSAVGGGGGGGAGAAGGAGTT
jgi:hypothetical protein